MASESSWKGKALGRVSGNREWIDVMMDEGSDTDCDMETMQPSADGDSCVAVQS